MERHIHEKLEINLSSSLGITFTNRRRNKIYQQLSPLEEKPNSPAAGAQYSTAAQAVHLSAVQAPHQAAHQIMTTAEESHLPETKHSHSLSATHSRAKTFPVAGALIHKKFENQNH